MASMMDYLFLLVKRIQRIQSRAVHAGAHQPSKTDGAENRRYRQAPGDLSSVRLRMRGAAHLTTEQAHRI